VTYLDNAATSFPKPEAVYQALDRCAREQLANPGRSGHKLALGAERILEEGRLRLNRLLGGAGVDRWAFTLNGTDALNMAIKGLLRPGDHVITTDLEHNSVSRPLVALHRAGVIELTRVAHDGQGTIDPEAIRKAFTPATRAVVITHGSNVLGTVQPIREIASLARERGIRMIVDAAQTAGVIPIDARADGIDLLALPGHKSLLGPTGTGALYVAPGIELRPWREGGTGGDSVSPTQPTEYPFFLEGGTPNVLGIAGLIAGIGYIEERGLAAIHAHETQLIERLRGRLLALDCELFGHADPTRRVGTLSFRHAALPANELGGILDQAFDIAVRPGLHCAPYVHRSLGTESEGLVRASVGPFNTENDIDALADSLGEIVGGV
jgi:cysteine desulfurase family protein